ncbi:MAG: class I SAM-dependent methyltransferase [Bryobacterales bacterium]|nr:class I SAM-dependent methyltransferase [Bryobacterales bacterium]
MSNASATAGKRPTVSAPPSHVDDRDLFAHQRSACPACNSSSFETVLRTGEEPAPRTLVACSRCSLLRILGNTSRCRTRTFADAVHFALPAGTLIDSLFAGLLRAALRPKLRFLSQAVMRTAPGETVLDCGDDDGTVARAIESFGARSLAVVRNAESLSGADCRDSARVVAADPADPPLRASTFGTICRLRGFAHDGDPVHWLQSARELLAPGGRLVIQTFDSGSWAFLVTGSHWAGLEGDCASYAFRAADLEVLLEACGYQTTRRSHFFPLLNASIWVSSLFPCLDPDRRRAGSSPSTWRTFVLDGVYALALVLFLPIALMESVCQTGSILMVEAEPK